MSNAIRFLETLGQDPSLSRISPEQLESLITALNVSPEQGDALRNGDAALLNQLVGGRDKMAKLVWEPGEQQVPDGDEPDSGAEESPEDDSEKG